MQALKQVQEKINSHLSALQLLFNEQQRLQDRLRGIAGAGASCSATELPPDSLVKGETVDAVPCSSAVIPDHQLWERAYPHGAETKTSPAGLGKVEDSDSDDSSSYSHKTESTTGPRQICGYMPDLRSSSWKSEDSDHSCHKMKSKSHDRRSKRDIISIGKPHSLLKVQIPERRGDPKSLPKNLQYDGKTSWFSFKQRFESYIAVLKWEESECKDYLFWSLEGKALDFATLQMRLSNNFSFRQLMDKLEIRFGSLELTETSRLDFQQASQDHNESLEDWADRVLTLATTAYKDLPDEHVIKEAVAKFCQGCLDTKAAKHACLEQPCSIQEALNMVKHHQYISKVINIDSGSSGMNPCIDQVSIDTDYIKNLVKEMVAEKVQEQSPISDESSDDSDSGSDMACFFCKIPGHRKRDCRRYKAWLKKKSEKH